MNRFVEIDPRDAVPIWKQIEDSVAHLIASGALAPGAAVPSVRDLARDLRINPATVAKGYQRLVETGFLAVRRGEGTFVADAPPAFGKGERSRRLKEAAGKYAVTAVNLGASSGDAVDEVKAALGRLARPSEGAKQ
jgi:GntR family transcriptional regulator